MHAVKSERLDQGSQHFRRLRRIRCARPRRAKSHLASGHRVSWYGRLMPCRLLSVTACLENAARFPQWCKSHPMSNRSYPERWLHLWRAFEAENCPPLVSLVKFLSDCHEPRFYQSNFPNLAEVLV